MKRYWLFKYSNYYPIGGMLDCYGSYDTEIEAFIKSKGETNYQIFDAKEGKVVKTDDDDCTVAALWNDGTGNDDFLKTILP